MPLMFVEFSEEDMKFLRLVQNGYYSLYGRRKKIPMGKVLRGIVLEYREMMSSQSDPFENEEPDLIRRTALRLEELSRGSS